MSSRYDIPSEAEESVSDEVTISASSLSSTPIKRGARRVSVLERVSEYMGNLDADVLRAGLDLP
jgi:hypothetical protein